MAKAKKMLRLVAADRLDKDFIHRCEALHHSIDLQSSKPLPTFQARSEKHFCSQIAGPPTLSEVPYGVGGICATGKTPLVFIDRNVKIKFYQQKVLKDKLNLWATNHFGQTAFTLQQDWAPAHGAELTVALCNQLFPGAWDKDVWPSNSPDLNPLDFSIWSIL